MTRPVFLVYCPVTDDTISDLLGRPDYSYYFVMKRFAPLLAELGDVRQVKDLDDLGEAVESARADGGDPLLMLFAPPHEVPVDATCPVVPVFAWEFDTIPDEAFGGDPRSNWVSVLGSVPGAITHSEYAVSAVRGALGPDYLVASMPAPVADGFAAIEDADWTGEPRTLTLEGAIVDSRTMTVDPDHFYETPEFVTADQTLELSGVVFTAIFNPQDKRKNWYDIITAFVWAFRDNPDATLVLKLVHFERDLSCWMMLQEMRKLYPYSCRIVVIHGFLSTESFHDLLRATAFTVNAAHAEGQCLPLMEYMAAGKPAIAPNHTAMADYITDDSAFPVSSSIELAAWPQDPRQVFRCVRYRIKWDTLRDAYRAAFDVATNDLPRYRQMSQAARQAQLGNCSDAVTLERLRAFLAQLP
ncbi:MAG: glycosyltransferase family 1 protein [Actinobacteria bacterium]|nr:MAG: glycosyltransferase family 1 protein [Actinomycetota bacterium]